MPSSRRRAIRICRTPFAHFTNVSKHGQAPNGAWSGSYRAWASMIQRCKRDTDYVGVEVCERWKLFENFYSDMGDRPDGMSIDRINGQLGYFPDNCRWATASEQAKNRKTTVFLEHNGKRQCVADWAKELGVSRRTIGLRLASGWPVEKALSATRWVRKEKVA